MEVENMPLYKNLKGEYLLKKDIVKDFPHNFGIEKNETEFEYATTSGTTSDRMQIVRKPNWWLEEYTRTYSNNQKLKNVIDNNLHKVIFTTAQCSNLVCFLEKPPMEKRIINNTLYVNNTFNPWDWTENDIKEMVYEINTFKPYYMDADPVYLSIFLILKGKYGIEEELHKPEIITLSYEFVPNNLKKFIKRYFKTEVKNLYGTTEFGYAFLENDDGKMQLCKDLIEVSLLPIASENRLYSLIISSMKNEYMPLIKYRVGDMVIANEEEEKTFAEKGIVSKMAGREKDIIQDKISYSMIDEVISNTTDKIFLYQFYFITDNICYLKYITINGEKISNAEENKILDSLNVLGFDAQVKFDNVDDITPEKSGKFAIVKKIV